MIFQHILEVRLFGRTKPLYFSIYVDIFRKGVKLDQREFFFLAVSVNLEGGGYFYLKDAKSTEIKQGMKTKRIKIFHVLQFPFQRLFFQTMLEFRDSEEKNDCLVILWNTELQLQQHKGSVYLHCARASSRLLNSNSAVFTLDFNRSFYRMKIYLYLCMLYA